MRAFEGVRPSYFKHNNFMTEIILQKVNTADGGARFDLIGKDLPKNFLGLAADLDFKTKFGESDYKGMVLSPAMQKLSEQAKLINLAKAEPKSGKIVIGMTFKSSELAQLKDGLLASFLFKTGKMEAAGISNQVLSAYENGRKDIQAEWHVKNEVASVKAANSETAITVGEEGVLPGSNEVGLMPEMSSAEPAFVPVIENNSSGWSGEWWIVAVIGVLSLIVAVIYASRRGLPLGLPGNKDLGLVQGADFA